MAPSLTLGFHLLPALRAPLTMFPVASGAVTAESCPQAEGGRKVLGGEGASPLHWSQVVSTIQVQELVQPHFHKKENKFRKTWKGKWEMQRKEERLPEAPTEVHVQSPRAADTPPP